MKVASVVTEVVEIAIGRRGHGYAGRGAPSARELVSLERPSELRRVELMRCDEEGPKCHALDAAMVVNAEEVRVGERLKGERLFSQT